MSDYPIPLQEFLRLEQKVLDLEALVGRLLARVNDADQRLEALDPGAASVDPRASLGRLPDLQPIDMYIATCPTMDELAAKFGVTL